MSDSEVLPVKIQVWGKDMVAMGRGRYPYDCEASRKRPDAMIYNGDGSWTDQYSTAFAARDKSKDVFNLENQYELDTYEGFGKGYKKNLFATVEDVVEAFRVTPAEKLPSIQKGGIVVAYHDPQAGMRATFADKEVERAYHNAVGSENGKKPLKYVVQPGGAGWFRLYNTQGNLILGGGGFNSLDEAFEACDLWNGVAPGVSARSQQITAVAEGVAPAARLQTVTAELQNLAHGMMDAINDNDSDGYTLRSGQFELLASEYIGLVASEIAERQDLVAALDKRLAAHDFTYQTTCDPLSDEYQRHSSTMDDLERLAKANFKAARTLWDKHASSLTLGADGLPAGWTEAFAGGMATNTDSVRGGIVDTEIVSGKWFAIFNDDSISMVEGLNSRAEAFKAFGAALSKVAEPAFIDPNWKAQIDGLKSVTAAIDEAMASYHADKVFVANEECTLTVSASHGRVLKAVIRDHSFRETIDQIDRFDVDDVRDWTDRLSDHPGVEGQTFDFSVVGHWKNDGTYVAPNEEHRHVMEAEHGVNQGARP
ncbi:hypothetical protein [Cupriavidus pinatubonensis]|uniref:Uncharacterized protein n=1 Tax=Cupriavidus pinatubonensis TaxID=248026 RepID=A0ABN7YCH0_9BURK|nr:hypothetical protein [Cupriavidus pinatubonensis]CAG9169921.1 hypothetical protein LMG23994_01730 [Cupriavidus pinatubonensis]